LKHYITEDRKPYFVDAPAPELNPDYPCTLDLRQFWGKRKKWDFNPDFLQDCFE
jgi:hypothetical protein